MLLGALERTELVAGTEVKEAVDEPGVGDACGRCGVVAIAGLAFGTVATVAALELGTVEVGGPEATGTVAPPTETCEGGRVTTVAAGKV